MLSGQSTGEGNVVAVGATTDGEGGGNLIKI
jgi:hypothetical protein